MVAEDFYSSARANLDAARSLRALRQELSADQTVNESGRERGAIIRHLRVVPQFEITPARAMLGPWPPVVPSDRAARKKRAAWRSDDLAIHRLCRPRRIKILAKG